jgi:LysR family transcriptional regulator, regulator of abg operon
MSLEIRHLRYFEAVYKFRSFVRAAEDQRVTQSALTKSIKTLEGRLSTRLFDRTTHSVEPTEAGERLIHYARDVIASLYVLEQEAEHARGLNSGHVAVGSGPYPLEPLLTDAVHAFSLEYPKVQVSVQTGGADDLLDRLIHRQLDLVVCDVSKYATASFADQIAVEALPGEPIVLVHRIGHEITGTDLSPTDFARYAWAVPKSSPHFLRYLAPALRSQSAGALRPQYQVEIPSACLRIAEQGDVLTAVPQSLARRAIKGGKLAVTDLPDTFRTNDGIHTLKKKTQSPAVRTFINFVKKQAEDGVGDGPCGGRRPRR